MEEREREREREREQKGRVEDSDGVEREIWERWERGGRR